MMETLREKLRSMAGNPMIDDNIIREELLDIIYDHYKDDTLKLFLAIEHKDKKHVEKENIKISIAATELMNMFSYVSKLLYDNKTSKQAKAYLEHVLHGDNISQLVMVCKALFPKASAEYSSALGRWFFGKFVAMLTNHEDKYSEGGDFYEWAKQMNHLDYIKLVLEKQK